MVDILLSNYAFLYEYIMNIIEPIKEFEELSKNAPKILIEELKKFISK